MPFLQGAWLFYVLAWHDHCSIITRVSDITMNLPHSSLPGFSLRRLLCAAVCLFPSLLLAHPGHYHPDETDEFDFFRATFFHSHGTLDYVIGAVALLSLTVVCFHGKSTVRIAALVAAAGACSLLPIL